MIYRVNLGSPYNVDRRFYKLSTAMVYADKNCDYSEQDINIYDSEYHCVAYRKWIRCPYDDNCFSDDPIIFGDEGFYDDWVFSD